ncbi:MAG TPA: CPBP family intramembrane glutamic endopeptidase [Trueperaceae bacterium]
MNGESRSQGVLRGLASDLAALFPPNGRLSALLTLALLLQIGYWYFGAPGPASPRDPIHALRWVAWATVLLGLIPLLLCRPLGLRLERLGLTEGDSRTGWQAVGIGVLVVIPVAWFAAGDPAVRLAYPWPGAWAGSSALAFFAWAATYTCYYFAYEFFFRGFLLRGLEPALGATGALWVQTIASTMLHLGKPLLETIAALPAGLVFGLLALRTRSILYVALIHMTLGLATDLFSLLRAGQLG